MLISKNLDVLRTGLKREDVATNLHRGKGNFKMLCNKVTEEPEENLQKDIVRIFLIDYCDQGVVMSNYF